MLSVIFMIAGIPVGLLTTWILDVYGIRAALFLSGATNVVGTVIRAIGTNFDTRTEYFSKTYRNDKNETDFERPSSWSDNPRLMWILIGQIISAFSAAVLLVPTKLAATWFPETQRATANMFASLSNPLGILIAYTFEPIIIGHVPEKVTLIVGFEKREIPTFFEDSCSKRVKLVSQNSMF